MGTEPHILFPCPMLMADSTAYFPELSPNSGMDSSQRLSRPHNRKSHPRAGGSTDTTGEPRFHFSHPNPKAIWNSLDCLSQEATASHSSPPEVFPLLALRGWKSTTSSQWKRQLPQTPLINYGLSRAHRFCVCMCAHALVSSSSVCQHVGLLSIVLEQFYLINKNRSKITFGKQHIFKRKRRSEWTGKSNA